MNNVKNMFLRVSVRLYMLMLKLHELKRKALLVTLTFLTGGLFSQPALAAGGDQCRNVQWHCQLLHGPEGAGKNRRPASRTVFCHCRLRHDGSKEKQSADHRQ